MKKYPLPCLVIDLGTASKILAIDSDGYFLGCAIAPGVKLSLDALAEGAALLPSISFTKPAHAVGTNTAECMQSGSVFGTAAMLDGMTKRMLSELGVKKAAIVATGGLAKGIVTCCETEIIYDENLILDGIKAIYDESRGDLL